MLKNQASQKWRVFAFDHSTGVPVAGDAANITGKLTIDYAAPTALADTNPTEDSDGNGYYWFDITQTETDGDHLAINCESTTEDVTVLGDPPSVITTVRQTIDNGAYTVTITVTDGTSPVENATVRVSRSGQQGTAQTNASGEVVFALDAATWDVTITLAGFQPFATTLAVAGNISQAYALTGNLFALPAEAPLCRLDAVVRINGVPVQGAKIQAKLKNRNSATNDVVQSTVEDTATTDANGYASLSLLQPSAFVTGDGVYVIEAYHEDETIWSISAVMPDAVSVNIEDLLS
jgi:hypothetical protein